MPRGTTHSAQQHPILRVPCPLQPTDPSTPKLSIEQATKHRSSIAQESYGRRTQAHSFLPGSPKPGRPLQTSTLSASSALRIPRNPPRTPILPQSY